MLLILSLFTSSMYLEVWENVLLGLRGAEKKRKAWSFVLNSSKYRKLPCLDISSICYRNLEVQS